MAARGGKKGQSQVFLGNPDVLSSALLCTVRAGEFQLQLARQEPALGVRPDGPGTPSREPDPASLPAWEAEEERGRGGSQAPPEVLQITCRQKRHPGTQGLRAGEWLGEEAEGP